MNGEYTLIDVYEELRNLRETYREKATELALEYVKKDYEYDDEEGAAKRASARIYLQVYESLGGFLMRLAPFTEGPEAEVRKKLT